MIETKSGAASNITRMTTSDETKTFRKPRANPLPQKNMPLFRQPAPVEGVGIASRSIKIFFALIALATLCIVGFFWFSESL